MPIVANVSLSIVESPTVAIQRAELKALAGFIGDDDANPCLQWLAVYPDGTIGATDSRRAVLRVPHDSAPAGASNRGVASVLSAGNVRQILKLATASNPIGIRVEPDPNGQPTIVRVAVGGQTLIFEAGPYDRAAEIDVVFRGTRAPSGARQWCARATAATFAALSSVHPVRKTSISPQAVSVEPGGPFEPVRITLDATGDNQGAVWTALVMPMD